MLMAAQGAARARDELVVLLDVDNTLLDNDRFSADLDARLVLALGEDGRVRYRELYERLRDGRGYADYLAPLQLLRRGFADDPDLLQLSAFLLDYPFADLVYPRVAETLAHLRRFGRDRRRRAARHDPDGEDHDERDRVDERRNRLHRVEER